jgi:hypothetical protein
MSSRIREDQLSGSGSRPAYLDEFERKLAAALAQQADAKKTRLASMRSSDANQAVMLSPSLGEALTRSSAGGDAGRPVQVGRLRPSSETRERGTPHEALKVSGQYAGVAIAVGAATEPSAGGSGAVGATGGLSHGIDFESAEQPAAAPADLADASSADYASQPAPPIGVPGEMVESFAAELSQAIPDVFPRGGGNRPKPGIAAEEPVANEAADQHARETGVVNATNRDSRGWRFKALALTMSLAMAGAVFVRFGGMLAPASGAPGADGPNLSQNMVPAHVAAEQAPSAGALAPSAAPSAGSDLLKDRPDVNSAAVVATPTAPEVAETAAVDAMQPAGGRSNGTSPVSIVSTPDAATPATLPLAQSFNIKPAKPVQTVSAPTTNPISSAEFATEGSSVGHAPQTTAKRMRIVHDVGTPKAWVSKRGVPMKVVGKPSTRAVVTNNNATNPRVAVRAPSQPLPLGTPAVHDNMAKEPNATHAVVESAATAATPAATLQPSGLY